MHNTGKPTLVNIIFRGNNSLFEGGGMHNLSGDPTLTNVTFIGNRAEKASGGGIYSRSGNLTLTNITFSGNSAKSGGGLSSSEDGLSSGGNITLTNTIFSDNSAKENGGGMEVKGNATLKNVTFINNNAAKGGGIATYQYSHIMMTDMTFQSNSATQGGGMYNGGLVTIINGTFNHNSASEGGGIYNEDDGQELTLENATFYGNTASNSGGGIFNDSWYFATLTNNTFVNNSAKNYGGAIFNEKDGGGMIMISIFNTILWGNTSANGTQIYNKRGMNEVKDSVIQGGCPTNVTCENIFIGSPLLGTLGNYGGFTQTIPLYMGSSAIDNGDETNCPATDQRGTIRPQGAHCDIGAFEYVQGTTDTLTFNSIAAHDGWVLESSETSNAGGILNSATTTFNLGDNPTKKQYRSLLSFNTSSIPDNAVITNVTLKIKQAATAGSGNPVQIFQGFMADIKAGFLGTSINLEKTDFQATADKTVGPLNINPMNGWYSLNLTSSKAYINKLSTKGGVSQIRLQFKLDDNNDAIANYLTFYSGNTPIQNQPQLVIKYYVLPAPTRTPTSTQTRTPTITLTIQTPTRTLTPTRTATRTPFPGGTPTTIQIQLSQASDDAGTWQQDCSEKINNNEIYLGKCANGSGITSGFVFPNVSIPRGAQIISANIQFKVDGVYANNIAVAFYGEASGNAQTFSAGSLPKNRSLTSASTNWSLSASTPWSSGQIHISPGLESIIEEIINRPDWISGNQLAIIIKNASAPGVPNSHRRVFAYEREGVASAAQLIITYVDLNTPTPTLTNTSTLTETVTPSPTTTITPTPTETITISPTTTITPTSTSTDTQTPTDTETYTPTPTPTITPTDTETPTATP